jgi:hypothetical protein
MKINYHYGIFNRTLVIFKYKILLINAHKIHVFTLRK